MTDKRPLDDAELDALFGAAQSQVVTPSDDLMARIMADAAAVSVESLPESEKAVSSFWQSVLGMIGGWPAAAGLATATVAGLVLGLTSPDVIETWTDDYLADASTYVLEDLLPSYGGLFDEG